MSKEKTLRTSEETEVMQATGSQKTAGRGKRRGERLGGKLEYEPRSGQSTVQTVRYY